MTMPGLIIISLTFAVTAALLWAAWRGFKHYNRELDNLDKSQLRDLSNDGWDDSWSR